MSWRSIQGRALCVGHPIEWWEAHPHSKRAQQALEICHQCPVMEECRQWALSVEDPHYPFGIVGGLLASERRRIHQKERTL